MLAVVAAIRVSSKGQTGQASMELMYEVDAIAMAVIGDNGAGNSTRVRCGKMNPPAKTSLPASLALKMGRGVG